MNSFKHFIITPFNVDLISRSTAPVKDKILNYDYLETRWQFFYQFCYPNVYNQTNQNFKWLLFFDKETPVTFKKRLKILAEYDNIIIIYTPKKVDFQPFLVNILSEYTDKTITHIITSWLDNDDAIAIDYVDMVQKQFYGQNFEYINFPYGFILHKKGLYLKKNYCNQYLSLIEKNDDVLTCKIMKHNKIYGLSKKEGLPVNQVITKPMWIKLEHELNWCQNNKLKFQQVIPLFLGNLDNTFITNEFIYNYVNVFELDYIYPYIRDYIIHNQYQKSLAKRIKDLITVLNCKILPMYESLRYKNITSVNNNQQQLNIDKIKNICRQHSGVY